MAAGDEVRLGFRCADSERSNPTSRVASVSFQRSSRMRGRTLDDSCEKHGVRSRLGERGHLARRTHPMALIFRVLLLDVKQVLSIILSLLRRRSGGEEQGDRSETRQDALESREGRLTKPTMRNLVLVVAGMVTVGRRDPELSAETRAL